jgi:hypothetical protein
MCTKSGAGLALEAMRLVPQSVGLSRLAPHPPGVLGFAALQQKAQGPGLPGRPSRREGPFSRALSLLLIETRRATARARAQLRSVVLVTYSSS